PVETKAVPITTPAAPSIAKTDPSFEHVVAAGETIYSIAQKYQLTTYQLKNFNKLTSNELTVGQKLIIKGEKPAAVIPVASNNDDEPSESPETLKNPNLKRPAAVYGLNKIEEKGTGVWISDPDLDPNKMLILHRTAPVGTIIQITNPMTNRSTFAKVVGKFTENETTKDVIIVMTKAVADAVGALDKRFFCNLIYGPKDNEK
ncbi:MAG: LysM peptidoglycan-binding domain-containing protein, partial [Pedobacter sp.]